MSASIREKLNQLCVCSIPNISFVYYYLREDGEVHHLLARGDSDKFKVLCHVVQTRGDPSTIAKSKEYLESKMDISDNLQYSDKYEQILTDIRCMLDRHNCDDCFKKMEQMTLANVEITDWNDYVQEVNNLKKSIEKDPFCIVVGECFPKEELYEYRHEYEDRIEDIQKIIGEADDFFFAMEYYSRESGEMEIYSLASGEDLPGLEYLGEVIG